MDSIAVFPTKAAWTTSCGWHPTREQHFLQSPSYGLQGQAGQLPCVLRRFTGGDQARHYVCAVNGLRIRSDAPVQAAATFEIPK